jgi:hypothetical protein
MLRGKRNVLVRVPLRINNSRRTCRFVPDQVGSMSQAPQIKLLEDHDAPPSTSDTCSAWSIEHAAVE